MKSFEDQFPSLVKYPEATLVTSYDVRLKVPAQYYGLEDLKSLRKYIKSLEKQIKANATPSSEYI